MAIRLSDLRIMSVVLMALLSLFTATGPCLSQGGQGGGGLGGTAGMSGRSGEADRTVGRSILTPGQFGEWPITAREGETIIVRISSTVFDPAVEVVDADNKVIAQNDDVRTGEQDAQVVVTFTKAGRYRILVKAFKMAGGGQYEFSMRRFIAFQTTLGARMAGSLDQTRAKWFRFSANAGQTVIVTARASSYRPNIQLFTPVGDEREAPASEIDRGRRAVVRTPEKGTYYVRIGGGGERGDSYAATISLARELKTEVGKANPVQTLEAGGLDIWTIQGKAGDLIRLEAKSDRGSVYISPEFANTEAAAPDATVEESRSTPLITLPADPKAPGESIILLNKTGTYRFSVSQPLALSAAYTFSSRPAGREWKEGIDTDGVLRVGDSEYWMLQGKAGQIVEMEASSSTFDSSIELYNPTGDRVGINDDGAGARNALLTQLLSTTGRYLVRVHAHGDGGSGAYKLRRLPNPVKPLPQGILTKGSLGEGGVGIWSFAGRKDQTIIISVRSSDFDTFVRIYGPDGLEIASADDGGEGTDSLLAVRLPLDGTYTIWVSAKSGSGSYTVKVSDADK